MPSARIDQLTGDCTGDCTGDSTGPGTAFLLSALLSVALGACNVSVWMEDGIPKNGINSSSTSLNGNVQKVVAWGDDGDGYRFEWKGQGHPGVAEGDADFELFGDGGNGELLLEKYSSGDKTAQLQIVWAEGTPTRTFELGGVITPYEPIGAAWLAQAVPTTIRYMGLGASTRVPRLHAAGGVDAVLEDIALFESDVARTEYYGFIVESAAFSSAEVAVCVQRAATQIDSDAHLEDVLEEAIEARPGDAVILDGVLVAAASIDSDAHLTDLLETVVEEGGARGAQLTAVLQLAASSIDSDAHLADLLETVVDRGELQDDSLPAFLAAMESVNSDAHAADVLEELLESSAVSSETLARVLTVLGPQIASDAHLADLLDELPRARLGDPAVRQAFLAALATVESDAHMSDVLEDYLDTGDPAVLADLIDAAASGISSDAHLADVLEDVPPSALSDARVREAMRKAVASIGSEPHRNSVLSRFPDGALSD